MSVDTLTLAQRLRAAELPTEHAEAIAAAIGSAVLEGAATKDDLVTVKTELKADLEIARSVLEMQIEKVRTEVERTRNQLFLGLVSFQITIAGIIIAVIKL